MNVFDYFFYRLYIVYEKKEKGWSNIASASLGVTGLQFLSIFFIYMILRVTLKDVSILDLSVYGKTHVKIVIVSFAFLLDAFNYFKYRKKLKSLELKYRNHPMNKKFKVWMLYFVALFLLVTPIVIGIVLK